MSDKVFQDVTQKGSIPLKDQNNHLLATPALNEFSAREIQGIPAVDENPDNAILMFAYAKLLETCGWKVTHLTDCPLSTQRFTGNMVNKMHEKRTLGIVRRTLIIGKPDVLHRG